MRAGDWLFVSGTLALGAMGEVVGAGDVAAQTRHVLSSIKAVVEAAGGTMATIVYNQIFLKDLGDYAAMNKVYAEFFPAKPPARYCIRADLVKPDFLVEIASTAYLGR
jgi:aminoacrylate peracid reductase